MATEVGRGQAKCAYVTIVSGSMIQWTQCTIVQSPRNALHVAEILNSSNGLSSYHSTGRLYSKRATLRNTLE